MVPTAWQDEALARDGVSREVPCSALKGETVPDSLPAPRLLPPQVRAFLQPPMKGVVMETFGSGNGPTKPDLLQELRAAAERGLVIVNCTHCLQGAVTSDYGAGMVGAGGARAWGGGGGEPWPPASFTVHPLEQ